MLKRLTKWFHRGEKGFTLIELLIVIAILGIIAAIVIPNAAGFMRSGRLNAANTEVQNVKTAATGYMAENGGVFPGDSSLLGPYLSDIDALKGSYTFDTSNGKILTGTSTEWTDIEFDPDVQAWVPGT